MARRGFTPDTISQLKRAYRYLLTSKLNTTRALAEIAHQLPDVVLVPFPVVTDRQRSERWWGHWVTTRRMFIEYVKYVFAQVRMALNPDAGNRRTS